MRLAKAAGQLDGHHGSCSGLAMAPNWQSAGYKQPKRQYVVCSACDAGCDSWIWTDRLGSIPMCPCGQPWRKDGAKGASKPATTAPASGSGRKGRWWSKTDKYDSSGKWQDQIEEAKERKLWELAVDAGPESDEMALFRKKHPDSKRLEVKAEQPATVVAAKAAQRVQSLQTKLQRISKDHEEHLAGAKACEAEGTKVAAEMQVAKQLLKEAEAMVNPKAPEKPDEVGIVKPLKALTVEQLQLLEENPLAKQLAEDFNAKHSEVEARGKVLHDKLLELQAQKNEARKNEVPVNIPAGDDDEAGELVEEQSGAAEAVSSEVPVVPAASTEPVSARMERQHRKAEEERKAALATMQATLDARQASYHQKAKDKADEALQATAEAAGGSLG